MRGFTLLSLLVLLDLAIAQTVTDTITDTVTVTQSATCPASTGLASESASESASETSSSYSSIYSSISTSISASNSISSLESSLSESMSSVSSSISESLSSLSSSFSISETSSTGSPSASQAYRTIVIDPSCATFIPSSCYASSSPTDGGDDGGSSQTSSPTASSDLSSSITSSASLPDSTSSATSTAASSTSSECAPQGVQWAYYQNNAGPSNDGTYSTFDPTVYKDQTPEAEGTWPNVGGLFLDGTSPTASIYGSSQQLSVDNFALETQGYIVAATTGVYFINITLADDGTFVWLGTDATSGWSRQNAEIAAFYDYRGPGQGYHDWYLTAGSVLPFRTMLAQAGSQAQFKMTVTAPDGTDYMDSSSTPPSQNLIQYSCDSSINAPQYAAWGSQS